MTLWRRRRRRWHTGSELRMRQWAARAVRGWSRDRIGRGAVVADADATGSRSRSVEVVVVDSRTDSLCIVLALGFDLVGSRWRVS